MIWRIITALIGAIAIWTGIFAGLNFAPPAGADPGAINACWLTFIFLIIGGLAMIWGSTWRLAK